MKIGFVDKPPKDVYLAFSGGIDSVVLLHILLKRKYNVTLLTVDHNNYFAKREVEYCKGAAAFYDLDYVIENIPEYDRSTSLEGFWSKHRNDIFQSKDKIVLTGHHLNDAVEWYLMSTFQGTPKLMNIRNKNISRPLLGCHKTDIEAYATKHELGYLVDKTNFDINFNLRNKVRLDLVDRIKKYFPGIEKTVRKMLLDKQSRLEKEDKD
jgi:tRNA(Ile)-lysidine synthase